MGLTATDLDILIDLRERKVAVNRIVTIGRLSLYLHAMQLAKLRVHLPGSRALASYRWGDPADALLCELTGATEVSSIDMSDYQGSTVVHDMNQPLIDRRPDLAGQFDLVIDGGTLEHVFNFPVAAANLMFLVRLGGHVLMANPANNLCGHGFYQFTPELMHRLFSPDNGFRIGYVLLTESRHMSVEMDPRPRSYRVVDPKDLGRRILLRNNRPVMIRTLAEKIGDQPTDGLTAQQSDYVAAWANATKPKSHSGARRALRKVFDRFPLSLQSRMVEIAARNSLNNRVAMKRWRGILE